MAGAGKGNYLLITIAALNMIISLYYYLKVIKAMFMDANEDPIEQIKTSWSPRLAMIICVAGIIITGLASGAYQYIHSLLSLLKIIYNEFMAINKNHEFEELDGVKCAIVEKNASKERVAFLKDLLETNHFRSCSCSFSPT